MTSTSAATSLGRTGLQFAPPRTARAFISHRVVPSFPSMPRNTLPPIASAMAYNVSGPPNRQPITSKVKMRPLYPQRHQPPTMPTAGWAEGADATEPEAQCYSEAKRLVHRCTIRSMTDPAMRPAQGRPTKAAAQAASGAESGGATHIPFWFTPSSLASV
jgi:hypothetical protein